MKLWFFRTPGGIRGASFYRKPTKRDMKEFDTGRGSVCGIYLGLAEIAGFPELKPGECIPVELVPVKAKKKKARKG